MNSQKKNNRIILFQAREAAEIAVPPDSTSIINTATSRTKLGITGEDEPATPASEVG
jgi:hypothetical protein